MSEILESAPWSDLVPLLSWLLLALLVVFGLGTVYRIAHSRDRPTWDFLRGGTIAASFLWLASSLAFSFYATNFGTYDRTYGPFGAVVVLLVWLYVTAYVILAGAKLNREIGKSEEAATRHSRRTIWRTNALPARES